MGHAAVFQRMTAAEFLAWDETQTIKHEFVDGEVFAMAGAEDRHVMTSGNVYMALRQHLRGTPCRAYMADMKLFVRADDRFFYPDVLVTCSDADRDSPRMKSDATLIAEVLSPGTAAYDRGDKFAYYRRLPSLQEYLLVDTIKRRADVFRKGADGLWVLHPFDAGQTLHLASVDLDIAADVLFEDVEPPAPAPDAAAESA